MKKNNSPGDSNFDELSPNDIKFIEKYRYEKPPGTIARYLEKPVGIIKKYLEGLDEKTTLNKSAYRSCDELRQLPEYELAKLEYTPDEMLFYEHSYAEMKDQFREDILATERKQVFQAIELDVFMRRVKTAQMRLTMDIKRIDEQISDEQDKDPSLINRDDIRIMQDQKNGCLSATQASSKQYNDLLDKHTKILDKLKATRDQRLSRVESSKVTFVGLIKMLQDREFRERETKMLEFVKKSKEVQKNKLSEYHTYKDGETDFPLQNSETISVREERLKNDKKK